MAVTVIMTVISSQWSFSDKNPASHMVMTVVSVMSDLSHVVYFNTSDENSHGIDGLHPSDAFSSMTSFFSCLSHQSQSISSR